MSVGGTVENTMKGGRTEQRGGDKKIKKRGGQTGSRGGCLKMGRGWNPLANCDKWMIFAVKVAVDGYDGK